MEKRDRNPSFVLHRKEILQVQNNIRDLLTWTKDKSEVEIVDLILKLREKLMRARKHQLPVKEELLVRLEQSIQTIISSLPEDLQTLLHRQ
ncbi:protein DENND6B-like [Sinocyclocheilus grahami]|uniref:protein DENND6B-like n=1 Tax=Sinocyclocheilus grahami TaxID=75366 RepID=UPI0007AC5C42|nr:PREDICTED: protein DENND6B-like [Sinocyclocheilus grahami]